MKLVESTGTSQTKQKVDPRMKLPNTKLKKNKISKVVNVPRL